MGAPGLTLTGHWPRAEHSACIDLFPPPRHLGGGYWEKEYLGAYWSDLSAALDFSLMCPKKLLNPVQSLSSG